jgi:hypothetical protein
LRTTRVTLPQSLFYEAEHPRKPPEQLSNRSSARPNTLCKPLEQPSFDRSFAEPSANHPLEHHPLEYHPPEYVRLTYVLKALQLQLQLYLQVKPLELWNHTLPESRYFTPKFLAADEIYEPSNPSTNYPFYERTTSLSSPSFLRAIYTHIRKGLRPILVVEYGLGYMELVI